MVTIKEISSKKHIKTFIKFIETLYGDSLYFVPDMISSQVNDFLKDKNPAYEYCETKLFLAYRDKKIVGRIAAIYNTKANEKTGKNQMRFFHADYIDDSEVTDKLFNAVEEWAREKGCISVHGPLGFSDLDREGLLIEGYDRVGQFFVNYNYPYYKEHMERMGYVKDVDWIENLITLTPGKVDERMQKLARLSDSVEARMKLHTAKLTSRKAIRPYVKRIFELYNDTYRILYGTTALTDRQVEKYVDEFLPIIKPETTCILLNEHEEVVAFGVGAPSIAKAQQKNRGRLFPFGWYHVLRALNGKNDTLDMFLIAVRPELHGTGINAVIINKVLQYALKSGIKYAETGPELEHNYDVQSHWRYFDAIQHKRRRAFIKEL